VRDGEFKPGELLPGTRYRVVGLIGSGGMGLVYDVEHVELGKRFVLKALLSDLAGREDIVARLRNEQRALGRLQHPNIIAVTDAGVTSTNLPFFVMERLEGETLGARLKRNKRLSVVDAITIARGVLEGLSAAHEIGVVHRDIKPQNIFLSSGLRPKILDFGVAKIADAASVITARGVAIGTPRYMSPEQVGGEGVDGRSDLYAVGLLLFETIAGRGPFDDTRDANEMLLAHLGKPAPRLGSLAAGVTRELDALIASLLAKAPGDRPPTARAAVAALTAVLGRYGGGTALDAPTPLASYSTTTQPLFVPGSGSRPISALRDDLGVRHPVTLEDPTTANPTTHVMLDVVSDAATSFAEASAPGGTLYDPSSRALTIAQPNFVVPPEAVRTERLEVIGMPRPSGDDVTHTRVPATPNDGTPSLAPVRVVGSRSQRGRPLALWAVGAALLALLGGAYLLSRSGATQSASAPLEEPSPVADTEGSEAKRSAALQKEHVVEALPSVASAGEKPSAAPTPKPSSLELGAPRERSTVSRKQASSAAPPARASSDVQERVPSSRALRASSAAPLPAGLPGSGL
jgi:serine/threonine-protein kinase